MPRPHFPPPARALALLASLALGCVHHPHTSTQPLRGPRIIDGPDTATLPIYRSLPGGDRIFVEADLGDGTPRAFLVDTGAQISVLSKSAAQAVGLPVQRLPGGVALQGLTSTVSVDAFTRVPALHLGRFTVHDVPFAVDVSTLPDHVGAVPVAGILGMDVWGRFEVALDYPAAVLELARPGRLPVPDTAAPLLFDGHRAMTRVVLDVAGQDGQEPLKEDVLLQVDTGLTDIVLRGHVDDALAGRSTQGEAAVMGVGAMTDVPGTFLRHTRQVKVAAVELGGVTVRRDLQATWFDADAARTAHPAGLIGHEVLDGYRVLLDFQGQHIALQPSEGPGRQRDLQHHQLDRLRHCHKASCLADRAKVALVLGENDKARQWLQRAIDRDAGDVEASVLLARLLRFQGDAPGALAIERKLAPEALVDQGELDATVNALGLAGKRDDAVALAQAAVKVRPKAPISWVALADARLAGGDASGARAALHQATEVAENPDAWLFRQAWIAQAEGDHDGALAYIERAVDLDPRQGPALWFYARLVHGTAEVDMLRHDLDRAAARLHPGAGPSDFLAAAWRAVGEDDKAAFLATAARTRDCAQVTDPAARDNCKAWYSAMGGIDLDQAHTQVTRALQLHPGRAEYLDTLAVVAEDRGDAEAARDAARRAAALRPDDVYFLWQAARLDQSPKADGTAGR
jgi:Flp pilus assembly protein TadD, contains TPR repeats